MREISVLVLLYLLPLLSSSSRDVFSDVSSEGFLLRAFYHDEQNTDDYPYTAASKIQTVLMLSRYNFKNGRKVHPIRSSSTVTQLLYSCN